MSDAPLAAGMKLVVASHNPGKVWEIKKLIAPYGLDAVSAGDLDLPEPDETETTFAGNARLKARAAADASGLPALADDSGLEVEALGGAPGIYSARWAGPGKDFAVAMEKVASEVKARHGWAAPGPRANFSCALCLALPGGEDQIFEGKVFGHLVWPPRGGNGFGYDPMFVADGETDTFGEIAPDKKHAMSHRARAFEMFEAACLSGLARVAAGAGDAGLRGVGFEALSAAAANLSTRAELAQFVAHLRADLDADAAAWRHRTLSEFLGGLERALDDAGQSTGVGEEEPRWRTVAKVLLAGR